MSLAVLNATLFRIDDHLAAATPSFTEQSVIRYYLCRSGIPVLETLFMLCPIPASKEFRAFSEMASLKGAIDIWKELISRFLPVPDHMTEAEYMHRLTEEINAGEALVGASLRTWSKRCNWDLCFCSFSFAVHHPQPQTTEDEQKPARIRCPHRMKICTGCWKALYCGKNCQERRVRH